MPRRLSPLYPVVVAMLLVFAAPAARSGPILNEADGRAPFGDVLSLNSYLLARGIDPVKDRIALAQGRSGDNRLTGVWEVGISATFGKAEAPVDGGAQYRWTKSDDSSWVPFSLSRSGDRLSFEVGKAVISQLDGRFRDIATLGLFTGARREDDEVRLQNLSLNGSRLREMSVSDELRGGDDDGQAGFTVVEKLHGDFILAGEARMRWEDVLDTKDPNRMMFQLAGYRAGSSGVNPPVAGPGSNLVAPIPEPASALVLLAGVLGLAGQYRVRSTLRACAAAKQA